METEEIEITDRFTEIVNELALHYAMNRMIKKYGMSTLIGGITDEGREQNRDLWKELLTYFKPETQFSEIRKFIRELSHQL